MALPTGTLDPKFDGWALSTVGFIPTGASVPLSYPGSSKPAALWEGSVSAPTRMEGRRILLAGTIIGTSPQNAEAQIATLIKNLRGTDRVKYGRLDLYGNGHWWAQLTERIQVVHLPGQGAIAISLEFEAADPWRRADTLVSVSESPSSSVPTVTLTWETDFDGDAPRIPFILNLGTGWLQGEKFRLYNSTVGWRFEHVVTQNLTGSGQDLVVDGEVGEILEGTSVVGEGVSGSYPYLRGGVSNVLDFTGCDRFGTFTIELWDRFAG